MLGLFITSVISGTVVGGVTSAQNYCKYQAQISDTITQTNTFIANATKTYDNLVEEDQTVLSDTASLQMAAMASTNNLLTLRQNYVNQLKKYQLIALFFVVIVFAMLLGKKLKIY